MSPVGQKLVVADVEKQVEDQGRCEMELILYFGEVGVAHFDKTDEGGLAKHVE